MFLRSLHDLSESRLRLQCFTPRGLVLRKRSFRFGQWYRSLPKLIWVFGNAPREGCDLERVQEFRKPDRSRSFWFWMTPREGKAANPFHSLAALQKLAHHASCRFSPRSRSPLTSAIFTQPFWDANQPTIGFSALVLPRNQWNADAPGRESVPRASGPARGTESPHHTMLGKGALSLIYCLSARTAHEDVRSTLLVWPQLPPSDCGDCSTANVEEPMFGSSTKPVECRCSW